MGVALKSTTPVGAGPVDTTKSTLVPARYADTARRILADDVTGRDRFAGFGRYGSEHQPLTHDRGFGRGLAQAHDVRHGDENRWTGGHYEVHARARFHAGAAHRVLADDVTGGNGVARRHRYGTHNQPFALDGASRRRFGQTDDVRHGAENRRGAWNASEAHVVDANLGGLVVERLLVVEAPNRDGVIACRQCTERHLELLPSSGLGPAAVAVTDDLSDVVVRARSIQGAVHADQSLAELVALVVRSLGQVVG